MPETTVRRACNGFDGEPSPDAEWTPEGAFELLEEVARQLRALGGVLDRIIPGLRTATGHPAPSEGDAA